MIVDWLAVLAFAVLEVALLARATRNDDGRPRVPRAVATKAVTLGSVARYHLRRA